MSITHIRYWGSYFKRSKQVSSLELRRKIAKEGWNLYLVCCKPPTNPHFLDKILSTGTKIIYLPRPRRNFDLGCIWRAYRLCRRLKCDIFHCDNMHTSPLIGAALAGVPVRIWSKRAMNSAYEKQKKLTFRDRLIISVRVSVWLSTKVLAVSNAVKEELVGLGFPPSKFIVFPNAINVGKISGSERCHKRSKYGDKNGQVVFTTIGHAVPVKGWDILIRSFAAVLNEYPDAKLQLVGSVTGINEREHFRSLENYIRDLGIADNVCFLGKVQDISKVLALSDVFVLPSRSEGYGKVLVEALMLGLPCISTKVGCATEVIDDGLNGLLVERGNEKQLSDAMLSLAKNPQLRSKIAHAVQARNNYAPTSSEYSDRLIELYKELLNENRR